MEPITPVSLLLSAMGSFVAEYPKTIAVIVIFKVAMEFFLFHATRIAKQ